VAGCKVGMDNMRGNRRRWGQNAANGTGTGWRRGQGCIVWGGNGVKQRVPVSFSRPALHP